MERTTVLVLCFAAAAGGGVAAGYAPDPAWIAAVLAQRAATGVVVAAFAAVALAAVAGRRRVAGPPIASQTAIAYELFVDVWARQLTAPAPDSGGDRDLAADFRLLNRVLTLYGSKAVLLAHARMRAALEAGVAPATIAPRFARAVDAIRRDIGRGGSGVMTRELRRLLLDTDAAGVRPGVLGAPTERDGLTHSMDDPPPWTAAAGALGVRARVSVSLKGRP